TAATVTAAGAANVVAADACPAVPSSTAASAAGAAAAARIVVSFLIRGASFSLEGVGLCGPAPPPSCGPAPPPSCGPAPPPSCGAGPGSGPCAPACAEHRTRFGRRGCCAGRAPCSE